MAKATRAERKRQGSLSAKPPGKQTPAMIPLILGARMGTIPDVPRTPPSQGRLPWYEGTLLWGALGLGTAIVLSVVAAAVTDLRWLLFVALPLFWAVTWAAFRAIKRGRIRWFSVIGTSVLLTIGLYGLYVALAPSDGGNNTATQSMSPVTLEQIEAAVRSAAPQRGSAPPPQPLPEKPSDRQEASEPTTTQRPYDLTGSRRRTFLDLLRVQTGPRDTIRIGCIAWSDAACVAAGRFLFLFSEAGWTIDADRVYRLEPTIPIDGIALVSRMRSEDRVQKRPPHQGFWQQMNPSQITIWSAFSKMGIPVSSSGDPEMPQDMLGVYFGPEPDQHGSRRPE